MGYRGKLREQEQGCRLRAAGKTLDEIAAELGVAKSSVSRWVRDVEFVPRPRGRARRRGPNSLQVRKQAEIDEQVALGVARIGTLDEQAFLAAGAALYAGEGAKTDGAVAFANSDPAMVAFFCAWLRRFFDIDESRLRVRLYLHEGLDYDAAVEHWARVTGIPPDQFRTPYRAAADATIRHNKHEYGCAVVRLTCSSTHRAVMGVVRALLSSTAYSGVAQLAEQSAVNRKV